MAVRWADHPMSTSLRLRDRMRGVLLGTLVGDAFGNPFEGVAASALDAQLHRRAKHPGPWRYTDDGAMTIALVESLLETGTIVPACLLARFQAHYEPARGFGRGMKLALAAFERGVPWESVPYVAWPEGSRGNGGAVRAGAITLRAWQDVAALHNATTLATRVTHAHDEAISAALAQVTLVHLILTQPSLVDSPAEFLQHAASLLVSTPLAASLLDSVATVVASSPSPLDIARSFGTSTMARESVPAAIASFVRSHATFEQAVLHAAAMGGDVDSICALVGCLAGAMHGFSGMPSSWLDALASETPSLKVLCDLADDVAGLEPVPFDKEAI